VKRNRKWAKLLGARGKHWGGVLKDSWGGLKQCEECSLSGETGEDMGGRHRSRTFCTGAQMWEKGGKKGKKKALLVNKRKKFKSSRCHRVSGRAPKPVAVAICSR